MQISGADRDRRLQRAARLLAVRVPEPAVVRASSLLRSIHARKLYLPSLFRVFDEADWMQERALNASNASNASSASSISSASSAASANKSYTSRWVYSICTFCTLNSTRATHTIGFSTWKVYRSVLSSPSQCCGSFFSVKRSQRSSLKSICILSTSSFSFLPTSILLCLYYKHFKNIYWYASCFIYFITVISLAIMGL